VQAPGAAFPGEEPDTRFELRPAGRQGVPAAHLQSRACDAARGKKSGLWPCSVVLRCKTMSTASRPKRRSDRPGPRSEERKSDPGGGPGIVIPPELTDEQRAEVDKLIAVGEAEMREGKLVDFDAVMDEIDAEHQG